MITMLVELRKIFALYALITNDVLTFIHLHATCPLIMHFVLVV